MCSVANTSIGDYGSGGNLMLALASAVGRLRLRKMMTHELPDYLYEPLEFLAKRTLNETDLQVTRKVEKIRSDIAKRSKEFAGAFSNFISVKTAATELGIGTSANEAKTYSLTEVAAISSVQPIWGAFLYLCAKNKKAKTILELGGAAGISGCYLASSPSCVRFVTVEGSESRARLAKNHLRQVTSYAEVVVRSFEQGLDKILPTLDNGLDLVFVDGTKRLEDILNLFTRIKPYLNSQSLIIFDDIRWSLEMWRVWKQICRQQGLQYTVDVGRMGVCVWEANEAKTKVETLFKFAGLDLYGIRHRIIQL